ncbi:RNA-binding cell elongation regulator Jag/EloR [Streptococcus halichoeri]|uniref:RNA-binding cell elongation regulator Jag/EloR n=1 Tax=Streptococcus halichoeri TaxID=254785 RepID=UPI00135BC4F3|nr:RNA-binding cell elongation regulator Jag/EloR [Streptococcus halichoeri]
MGIYTGKTVEAAIEAGLKDLQLPRLKAHIKVISKEKKGFLGFGKRLAQVQVEDISKAQAAQTAQSEPTVTKPSEPTESNQAASAPQSAASATLVTPEPELTTAEAKAQMGETQRQPAQSEKDLAQADSLLDQVSVQMAPALSDDIDQATAEVADYVTKVIYEMDIEASIDTSHNRRQINLQIETPDAGRVIGYHGKVLKSLQLLAQNFLHDRYSKSFSVVLNVHDYVEHRTETLIDFTQKVATRVLETGKDYTMDPMSNSERKIVHKTISAIEGVTSFSEGNDPNRFVVVSLQK